MSNPAYIWLVDENGSPIVGDSLVSGRLGAIELKSVNHNVSIPTDQHTGRLTGTRVHSPISLQKEFDKATPILYRALCQGVTLQSATIKMYQITETGTEAEYFNIILDNVKIVAITPNLYPGGQTGTHFENILLRYETITWKYCDGNIIYKDTWNNRAVA
ncbi:Hcp family type VI secretion system effector [Rahnella aquatilis]|uniref:Hcp family type VI secretion system effector n=1 Tax=Rahnella aquatilis TaxID=34038 RepID=UPI0006479F24|nr:type VI secretion system tube protein TssD [Rahnella aquatilis]